MATPNGTKKNCSTQNRLRHFRFSSCLFFPMALSMTGSQRIDCLGSNKSLSHGKQKYFVVLYPLDIFQKGKV